MGKGVPTIFIHGLYSCQYTWRFNVGPLSNHFEVITIDLPGHGFSEMSLRFDYSIASLASTLYKFIRTLGLKRVNLVGHSFGGAICQCLCNEYIEVVNKLVLVASSSLTRIPEQRDAKYLKNLLLFTYYDKSLITEDIVDLRKQILCRPRSKEVEDLIKDVAFGPNTPAAVPQPNVACLIIWGQNDAILPPCEAQEFMQLYPCSRLVMIDQCGHAPHEEKPANFNQEILNFLQAS